MGIALQELGAEWVPIEARHLKAVISGQGSPSLLIDGDPDIKEESVDELALDGIVWRISENDFDKYSNIFSLLAQRYPMVNDWQCVWTCSDKWRTTAKLAASGIPVIPTVLLTPDMPIPRFSSQKTVIKPSVGAGGTGVRLAEPGTIASITVPHVAQPLVEGPSGAHIRVTVCGSTPVVAIHRIPDADHQGNEIEINNVSVGGMPVPAPMEPVRELAIQVAKCIGGDILGIDLVPWNGKFAVLEVNSSPGFTGIAEPTAAAKHTLARLHGTHKSTDRKTQLLHQ